MCVPWEYFTSAAARIQTALITDEEIGTMPDLPPRDNDVPFSQALDAWAEASVPVLEDVARTYGSHITYKELAARVFESTGIHTKMLVRDLSSRLLNKVIRICNERGLPALSSLVVHSTDGMVGSGFDAVLLASGRDVPATELERERAAAAERLACYRVYCKDVPANAEPRLTLKYEARLNPVIKEAPRPKPICPRHGIQLPATGICDDCA